MKSTYLCTQIFQPSLLEIRMILPNPFARRGNTEDANTILEYAIDWAMQAGKLQMEKFRSRHLGIETKSSMHDS